MILIHLKLFLGNMLPEITFYQIDQIQIQILQILSASISPWVSSSFVLTLIITLMIIIMSTNVTLIVTLTITLNNQGQGKSQLDNSPNNVELSPISLSQFSPLTPGRYLSTSCILGMCMGPPRLPPTTSTLIKWRPSQTKRQGRPVHLLADPSQPACLPDSPHMSLTAALLPDTAHTAPALSRGVQNP